MSQHLFETLSLSPEVLQAVGEMNYNEMTPIQAAAIPLILDGQDIVGRSSTGTGKTAAFGLPAVERCGRVLPNRPQVLVLAPTRELALQISGEMRKYAKFKPSVRIATIYGGDSITAQMGLLRTANLVVGTPGRVMDHMRRETLLLDQLEMVVLDEADEMLNMGFLEDMETILSALPEERQTLMFSATMPQAIQRIAANFQKDPQIVRVVKKELTVPKVTQYYYEVKPRNKVEVMCRLLDLYSPKLSVAFCNTKKQVDELTSELNTNNLEQYELENLRELLALDQKYPSYEKVAANVIGKSSGNWFSYFTIDKGTDDGIEVDMNVIAGSGLVGIVTDVGPNYAKVTSIINDTAQVSGMVTTTSDNLIVNGSLQNMNENMVIEFSNLNDSDNKVAVGDPVVTSYISDKYQQGILIGYISSLSTDSNNLTKSGTITPAVDFEHIEEVLVILDKKQSAGE